MKRLEDGINVDVDVDVYCAGQISISPDMRQHGCRDEEGG